MARSAVATVSQGCRAHHPHSLQKEKREKNDERALRCAFTEQRAEKIQLIKTLLFLGPRNRSHLYKMNESQRGIHCVRRVFSPLSLRDVIQLAGKKNRSITS